nr:glycosyltransferase [uncultured Methanoregula sp.]
MIVKKEKFQEELKDKNLLILTPSYPNRDDSLISETFVKYQVAELKQYFKKVIVIAPVFQSLGYLKRDKLCKDYSYDNVEVYYPRCIYIPIDWLSVILIDNRMKIVEKTIKQKNIHFDIIHAHFTWPSGYIGILLKRKFGTPVITTIHENGDWLANEVKMDHPLMNAVWSEANALIRVNKKDIPLLKQFNTKIYSIPNGFSPDFHPIDTVSARKQLGLPLDKKIIFTLGNLIKRKGFNYLIDAMEIVYKQRSDVLCFIGGAGPEKKKLSQQINQRSIQGCVKLLGPVPNEMLPDWMNTCDIFVLPSLSEGNPTVMFECLGCGKPFIGTNVGGVSEIIISDDYGMLIESTDPNGLATKILSAINKEWNQEKILDYGNKFTWEKIVEEIVQIYLKSLD